MTAGLRVSLCNGTARESGAYGRVLASCFRLTDAPTLLTSTLKSAALAVTRLTSGLAMPQRSLPIPPERAYLVRLQLRDLPCAQLWLGQRLAFEGALPRGSMGIVQLEERPSFHLHAGFDMLLFYLPQIAFAELSSQSAPGADLASAQTLTDPIVRELGHALLPVLESERAPNDLFFDHVARALHAHLVRRYGRVPAASIPARGRLASWQERIATQMLGADLAREPGIEEIAQACGMPSARFVRAFRKSTGLPPYRWLRGRRVERAKELLFGTSLSLSQIACDCGFADQSHLTRVFAEWIGTTPGAWREARRGSQCLPLPALRAPPTSDGLVLAADAA